MYLLSVPGTFKDRQRILGKPELSAGKEDPFAEAFKAVQDEDHPL
ncbi:hypothetical protein Lac2_12820 [Claveliimonas bilis]|nr:hypothetical protein Lac2_12820 [Claveliimonas bilis]